MSKPIKDTTKQMEVKDKELMERLEVMLTRICHLTGQHYGDKYWGAIVKGGVVDLTLFISSLIDEEKEKSFAEGYNEAHKEAASYINSQEK